jgi:uncharacterized protein (TIGR02271 family)
MDIRPTSPDGSSSQERSDKIPVLEEQLHLGVRRHETGKVRAYKKVHEEDLIVSGPVTSEEMQVERIPLNQYIEGAPPEVRYEGDTMIIPVVQEEVVVQTRLVLVEEVRITKKRVETTMERPITVRKEEIIVERFPTEGSVHKKV